MRAAQRVRIGNRGGPPAFAPVISLGGVLILVFGSKQMPTKSSRGIPRRGRY